MRKRRRPGPPGIGPTGTQLRLWQGPWRHPQGQVPMHTPAAAVVGGRGTSLGSGGPGIPVSAVGSAFPSPGRGQLPASGELSAIGQLGVTWHSLHGLLSFRESLFRWAVSQTLFPRHLTSSLLCSWTKTPSSMRTPGPSKGT